MLFILLVFIDQNVNKVYIIYTVCIVSAKAGVIIGINIESLKQQLLDEDCLKVLTQCKEPKSFKEIRASKIPDGKLFEVLKKLKANEALLFADGKYYTSPDVLEYMD